MFIAIALGVVALLLIYFEFFLPGGFMAIAGGVLLVASMILFAMKSPGFLGISIYFVLMIALLVLVCKLALWRIKSAHPDRSVYLSKDQEGYVASSFDKSLIGKTGRCLSDLKPSGHVSVDGNQYQALSESGYISKDTEVVVIGGKGAHLIVNLKI
jgi:membrane-bound serine protease (ClpP class)